MVVVRIHNIKNVVGQMLLLHLLLDHRGYKNSAAGRQAGRPAGLHSPLVEDKDTDMS